MSKTPEQNEAWIEPALRTFGPPVIGLIAAIAILVSVSPSITSFGRVDEDHFIALAREEGLDARKGTLRGMYRVVEQNDPATLASDAFVRQLFDDLKDKRLLYDGQQFFVFAGKHLDKSDPVAWAPSNWTTDHALHASDKTVPLKFFLDNWEFYSRRIFMQLTHQADVDFAFDVDAQGRYGFRVVNPVPAKELFAIASREPSPDPDELDPAGSRWWVPPDDLRELPRVYEVDHDFVDHLGTKRTVHIRVDLANSYVPQSPAIRLINGYTEDFKDFAIVDDGMKALARDITAPYANRDDKARAILAFTQSYRYQTDRIEGTKSAQAFLVSEEGDCEDSSTLTVTLWEAAGFDAAFLEFDNRTRGTPGHVMAAIDETSCCRGGAGFEVDGHTWLFGEGTSPGWHIGDQTDIERTMHLVMVRPYNGKPILINDP